MESITLVEGGQPSFYAENIPFSSSTIFFSSPTSKLISCHVLPRLKTLSNSNAFRQDLYNHAKMPHPGQSHNVVIYIRTDIKHNSRSGGCKFNLPSCPFLSPWSHFTHQTYSCTLWATACMISLATKLIHFVYLLIISSVFIFAGLTKPSVVFWPSTRPKMPFKVMHQKEVTHSNGSYERKLRRWARLIIWDKVKVPLQNDAPEESDLWTAWQLFLLDDDQTCHSKDWVGDRVCVELLYNSVKTEVSQLEIGRSYRRDVVGKATPSRRGPREPRWSLETREVADKMQ